MCHMDEQVAKLCYMGGQIEHDMCQILGEQKTIFKPEFEKLCLRIEKRLLTRGDLWAIEYFQRIKARIKQHPRPYPVHAMVTEAQSPGETVNEALLKAQSILT